MSVLTLYPPIAAASVVFFFWCMVEYRLYKRDLPAGQDGESALQLVWLLIPIAGIALYFWLVGLDYQSLGFVHVFFCTIAGELFSAVIIYGIHAAFIDPPKQTAARLYSYGVLVVLSGMIVGSAFIQR